MSVQKQQILKYYKDHGGDSGFKKLLSSESISHNPKILTLFYNTMSNNFNDKLYPFIQNNKFEQLIKQISGMSALPDGFNLNDIDERIKYLVDLFNKLDSMGFKVIIFSNSPKNRLEPFKKELKVDCCAKAGKPRKKSFIKVLNLYKFDLSEVTIIGDQLVTDIYGGNKVGITTILVNPMSNIDMPLTKIYRYIEKKEINKMTKKGLFKVGEYYD